MKWVLISVGSFAAVLCLMALVGAFLPRAHVSTRSAAFGKPPAQLHALVRDFAKTPSWRSGIKSVEILEPRNGRPSYREVSRHGAIAYVVLEDVPGLRLVTRIDDDTLPYGGTWTFEFASADRGGTLRITERGEVKNPIFRFLSRFVFGHTATLEAYLRDLGASLGEKTSVLP